MIGFIDGIHPDSGPQLAMIGLLLWDGKKWFEYTFRAGKKKGQIDHSPILAGLSKDNEQLEPPMESLSELWYWNPSTIETLRYMAARQTKHILCPELCKESYLMSLKGQLRLSLGSQHYSLREWTEGVLGKKCPEISCPSLIDLVGEEIKDQDIPAIRYDSWEEMEDKLLARLGCMRDLFKRLMDHGMTQNWYKSFFWS